LIDPAGGPDGAYTGSTAPRPALYADAAIDDLVAPCGEGEDFVHSRSLSIITGQKGPDASLQPWGIERPGSIL
jgi:hypothetical protein